MEDRGFWTALKTIHDLFMSKSNETRLRMIGFYLGKGYTPDEIVQHYGFQSREELKTSTGIVFISRPFTNRAIVE